MFTVEEIKPSRCTYKAECFLQAATARTQVVAVEVNRLTQQKALHKQQLLQHGLLL